MASKQLLVASWKSDISGNMQDLISLFIDMIVDWIRAHPEAPFSKFMLKNRGPGTDVVRMPRLVRLKNALIWLSWGVLFFALLTLIAYLAFGLKLVNENNVVFLGCFFMLVFATMICLAAGIWLLVRVIF
jgi:hypothetical protein